MNTTQDFGRNTQGNLLPFPSGQSRSPLSPKMRSHPSVAGAAESHDELIDQLVERSKELTVAAIVHVAVLWREGFLTTEEFVATLERMKGVER